MEFEKNYDKCITNITCSIAKYFELEYTNNTIKEIDDILDKNNIDNVIVVLCDGLGSNILKSFLAEDKFLRINHITDINSVYPSTTTAATTSILSGLNPVEHGWLGWDIYVKPIDKIVTMFLNTIKDTNKLAEEYNVARKYFPYKNITKRINEETKYNSKIILPFGEDHYKNLDHMIKKIIDETKKPGKKYIYAYYENPDSLLHQYGVGSEKSIKKINELNDKLEKLSEELQNSLLIITADHGHINCEPITLSENKEIFQLLNKDIWLEGRLCSFSIKENKHDEFKNVFKKLYGNDFILKTKKEAIEEKIFGPGTPNELFEDSLGDFIALAITNKYFRYNENSVLLKSMHAGTTEDEMIVPLILKVKANNENK